MEAISTEYELSLFYQNPPKSPFIRPCIGLRRDAFSKQNTYDTEFRLKHQLSQNCL